LKFKANRPAFGVVESLRESRNSARMWHHIKEMAHNERALL
jgi:hypothetical protein